jgi:geranylgeranyl pyrophosphate synthase
LKPIRSILDRGGKCWRSYLIAACCTSVGGDFHEHLDWLALPEVMHVGSLIVDDVEDESTVRRGGPACHSLFGAALAINAGSFAYFALQSLMERYRGSDATRAAIYREHVSLLRAGHAGQALDLLGFAEIVDEAKGGQGIAPSILEIHRLKSGIPFRAFARIGVLLGDGSPEQCDVLGEVMARVGTAFQIMDDVLGIEGFAGGLKEPCEDLRAGKLSYPVALALDRSSAGGQADLRGGLAAAKESPAELARVLDALDSTSAIEGSRQHAQDMALTARETALEHLPPSPALMHLCDFMGKVLDRVY